MLKLRKAVIQNKQRQGLLFLPERDIYPGKGVNMARTIGKKNIHIVQEKIKEAEGTGLEGNIEVFNYLQIHLPGEIWETWEGAYSEIEHLVWERR
jgi:hypothetical protein